MFQADSLYSEIRAAGYIMMYPAALAGYSIRNGERTDRRSIPLSINESEYVLLGSFKNALS